MTNTQKQPNIYDVADLAKVSHQTVSRVINNHPSIRVETRARVEAAMEKLGYRPNMAARALVTARTKMLGILSSDTDFTGPASMVHFMEKAARDAGYFVVSCGIDPSNPESVREGLSHLQQVGIEGLVVITPQSTAVDIARKEMRFVPVVTIDSMYRLDELSISVDNFSAASVATNHLIDLGHREILHISGPENWFESSTRAAGYTSTMLSHGLEPRVVPGNWSIERGFEIGSEFDFDKLRITAVFCANDQLALGLQRACLDRGIKVPERLSIVGFDNLPETPYYPIPLTTLTQDFQELGIRAMALLLAELNGEESLKHERIVPSLVVRKSTSYAPKL